MLPGISQKVRIQQSASQNSYIQFQKVFFVSQLDRLA